MPKVKFDRSNRPPATDTGRVCPKCGGKLMLKHYTTKGDDPKDATFIGCANYPKCKYTEFPEKPKPMAVGITCEKCKSPMTVFHYKDKKPPHAEKDAYACTNPDCKHVQFPKDTINKQEIAEDAQCPICGSPMYVKYYKDKKGKLVKYHKCSKSGCKGVDWLK
ncbi:hypothetical protein FACS1894166_10260 [Bacilli bacterium]|nr:hypothetical protein FACS1894166_10260 [Bacilli bacterium]